MSSNQLLQDELTAFCRSHALSEDGLRAIIEGHGVALNNDDPNINYEFFHEACFNEKVTEGILRYLLEYFPNAVRYTDGCIDDEEERAGGCTPLHSICYNKNVTLGMVQLLIDAFPDSLRHENNNACMPLHYLCGNENSDNGVAMEILKLIVEKCPESVRHAETDGILPLHFAAGFQSPEFCRLLIEAYPGSERKAADGPGALPFHLACINNTVATAEYLYQLYPESINVADNQGAYPIQYTMMAVVLDKRNTAVDEITRFLLECNPNVILQEFNGKIPFIFLHHCICENTDAIHESRAKLNECLKILQILYDAHPEAILDNQVASNNVDESCADIQTFIDTQLTYARQARDQTLMTTPDENWQLPLHRALRDNAATTLGSIKLLLKGNSSAVRCPDNRGMIPLHVACWHHESASVAEYLINLDPTSLRAIDFEHNTALHHACRGANHAIIALLIEKYGAVSVSKRNAHGQLPIDLLFASREVSDRDGEEYMESIFRLLRAYPAMMNCIPNTRTTSHSESKVSGKKRKINNIQEEEEGYYSYLSSVKRKLIRAFWGR